MDLSLLEKISKIYDQDVEVDAAYKEVIISSLDFELAQLGNQKLDLERQVIELTNDAAKLQKSIKSIDDEMASLNKSILSIQKVVIK